MQYLLFNGDSLNMFFRTLQTRLKHFKSQMMPSDYLSSMFLLLDRMIDLEAQYTQQSKTKVADILLDRVVSRNYLWLIYAQPSTYKHEVQSRVRFIKYIQENLSLLDDDLNVLTLIILLQIRNDAFLELSNATYVLISCALSKITSDRIFKGSTFVNLLMKSTS
jgi:hypothetical protein